MGDAGVDEVLSQHKKKANPNLQPELAGESVRVSKVWQGAKQSGNILWISTMCEVPS